MLRAIIGIYAIAATLPLLPLHSSPELIVAAQIVPPALFAVIHGLEVYRSRGILVFIVICFVVGNLMENVGVATGFPFGTYHFTGVMGPKLFYVPLLMGPAYLAIGYSSWTLSLLIAGVGERLTGSRAFGIPMLAASIMVAWDLCSEPIWSTVRHFWIWTGGGMYFGVPVSNFFGWFLVNYTIFQIFSFYLVRRNARMPRLGFSFWRLAVLSFAVVILANLATAVALWQIPSVSDSTGAVWKSSSIGMASLLFTIFLMGGFALFAWSRLCLKFSNPDHLPVVLHQQAAAK